MKKTTDKKQSLVAAAMLLKKRKRALTVSDINKNLVAAGLKPLTVLDLRKYFREVKDSVTGFIKYLLGNAFGKINKPETVPESEPVPEPDEPAEEKPAKAETKKAKAKAKKCCKAKKTCEQDLKLKGVCRISFEGDFDVAGYNMVANFENSIRALEALGGDTDDLLFLAGPETGNDWPEDYKGIRVVTSDAVSGVLLVHKDRFAV